MDRYEWQVETLESQHAALAAFKSGSHRKMVLTGRCSGRTTTGLAMVLAAALEKYDTCSMIMCDNEAQLEYLRKRVKQYLIDEVPEPYVEYDSRYNLRLINGSCIHFRKLSPHALRGMTLNCMFYDGHLNMLNPEHEELWMSLVPAIAAINGTFISTED